MSRLFWWSKTTKITQSAAAGQLQTFFERIPTMVWRAPTTHMIHVIMATMMEADPFIEGWKLEKITNDFFHIYHNDEVTLLVSGVGKMNVTMATTFALAALSARSVLNLGAAGSLGDVPIGKIFQITSIVESDRPVRQLNKQRIYTPQHLKGFDDAVLATQDIPVLDPRERAELALSADLIDMEGCAVAHVCKRFKTPCHLFKFVTDNMQKSEPSDIIENIEKFRSSFFDFCSRQILPALRRAT